MKEKVKKIIDGTVSLFRWFGFDGCIRIIVSCIMTVLLCLIMPWWLAGTIVFGIGIAKEVIWDKKMAQGTPDGKDLIADLIGILLGLL